MSVERYMSIVIKHWRSRLFSAKRACVVSLIIMFLIFTFNGTLLFTINYERVIHANESISAACYSTKAYITWHKVILTQLILNKNFIIILVYFSDSYLFVCNNTIISNYTCKYPFNIQNNICKKSI